MDSKYIIIAVCCIFWLGNPQHTPNPFTAYSNTSYFKNYDEYIFFGSGIKTLSQMIYFISIHRSLKWSNTVQNKQPNRHILAKVSITTIIIVTMHRERERECENFNDKNILTRTSWQFCLSLFNFKLILTHIRMKISFNHLIIHFKWIGRMQCITKMQRLCMV